MMTEELVKEFLSNLPKPKDWREGQFVYNILNRINSKATESVRFEYNTDCFYNDNKIDNFIKYWVKVINSYE